MRYELYVTRYKIMAEEQKNLKKVLLIDDDQFLLNMYAIKFQKSGYEVEVIKSAELGLEKLRAGAKYSAIIFDIVMPAMDGFQFAEVVKKEKLAGEAALIALTNQGQDVDIERGKSLGVDDYIVKASVLPSEVVKEVTAILMKNKDRAPSR